MPNDDDDDFYRPPHPTTAGLMFPARSKFTVRGFTLAMTPAEQYWRQIISASQGERETCLLALADPNLWNLHDQPQPVGFTDVDGRNRTHRFDYLAEYRDGSKVALAVKPADRAEKLNFRATLTAIRRDLPKGFADKVCLVTERSRHRKEVQNAELLNFFRRCQDNEADALVRERIKDLSDELSIAELASDTKRLGLNAECILKAFLVREGPLKRSDIASYLRECRDRFVSLASSGQLISDGSVSAEIEKFAMSERADEFFAKMADDCGVDLKSVLPEKQMMVLY